MLESISIARRKQGWSIENCSGLMLIFYTFCYVAYIAVGGLLFLWIENDPLDSTFHKIQVAKENVFKKFPNATGEVLDEFLSEMSSIGINGLKAVNDTESKWSYSQSVFFCVTVLTTIGYGHVTPVSHLGKAACIIYSAFGIPFTLLLLAGWVDRMMLAVNVLQRLSCTCFAKTLKPHAIQRLFFILVAVLICTLFFFIPAVLFSYFEQPWTYLDSLYFCFISLTTVGLGDFVPGMHAEIEDRALYRFAVAFYLIIGVVCMMFLMALAGQLREYSRQHKSNEEQDSIPRNKISYGSISEDKAALYNHDQYFFAESMTD